jgi:hypothetical protein
VEYTLENDPSSSSQKKWKEKEVVKAVYIDRAEVLVDDVRDIFGDI